MIKIDLKKMVLTAALVIGTVVVLPQTVEAKTKAITYNIDKQSVDYICKDIQAYGKVAHLREGDKNTYKIKIETKAKSVAEGRKKVNNFAKKLMKCDANTYGLSYGIKYDDYNTYKYDKKAKKYTTTLFNTANDIYWLNKIVSNSLHQEYYPGKYCSVRDVFPTDESFKKCSESVKADFITGYMGTDCMTYEGGAGKKNTFTWKKAYEGKVIGVCHDFAQMDKFALRLIAYNYEYQEEINWKANHEILLAKVKRADGDYDYFVGSNGGLATYGPGKEDLHSLLQYIKKLGIKHSEFLAWQLNAPKEYKSSKLEKEAYNYFVNSSTSELDDIAKNYK
ncbi:hypothetical protein ACTQ32_06215 [Roseburia faecis]|uniref:hypothetical protein n=1 Tax=Roseburia faecis TaxID=301302 RepID=UPI003F98C84C